MLIVGQHGEFGQLRNGEPVPRRQIQIEDDERLSIRVRDKNTGEEREVMGFFMPGVLTLEWEQGQQFSDLPFIGQNQS